MKLTNGTITIRPYETTDIDQIMKIADNPNVSRWLQRFPSPYSREDGERWIVHCQNSSPETAQAITLDNCLIGAIGIEIGKDLHARSAELGYWLGEQYWGKGYTTEAVKLFVRWAFNQFQIERISGKCFEANQGSVRVLEKAGFTFEGTLRNLVFKFGKPANVKLYSILKEECI